MTSTATDLFSRPPTIVGHLLTINDSTNYNTIGSRRTSYKQPSADKEQNHTDNPKNIRHQSEHFTDSEEAEQEQYTKRGKPHPPRIKRKASEQKDQDLNGLNTVI